MPQNGLAKIGLAKIGQIRMAKTGKAKVGLFRFHRVFGLVSEKSKGVCSPGLKTAHQLNPEGFSVYTSTTLRAAFLATDRVDLQFASKECTGNLVNPTFSS